MMFPRLAHNLLKNGYYPTDADTLSRVASMLSVTPQGKHFRMVDPCCGEGHALACLTTYLRELPSPGVLGDGTAQAALGNRKVHAFGVEYDKERYTHAKAHKAIERVDCADIQNTIFSVQQYGLVYLNPPYGEMLTDKAGTGQASHVDGKAKRLEYYFLERMMPTVQTDGVLIYVIPINWVTKPVASLIAKNFVNVTIHLAPESEFKQCVIAGIKRPSYKIDNEQAKQTYQLLLDAVETPPAGLPSQWLFEPYVIPEQIQGEHTVTVKTIDPELLGERIDALPKGGLGTLWPRFDLTFKTGTLNKRAPLNNLSTWHMALSLATGQVSGLVSAPDGSQLLVKGNTVKVKKISSTTETNEKGTAVVSTVKTDQFKAVIKAITFAPVTRLGQIVEIA
jgi:Uncharacterised methyltransferase family (DUF6094)